MPGSSATFREIAKATHAEEKATARQAGRQGAGGALLGSYDPGQPSCSHEPCLGPWVCEVWGAGGVQFAGNHTSEPHPKLRIFETGSVCTAPRHTERERQSTRERGWGRLEMARASDVGVLAS